MISLDFNSGLFSISFAYYSQFIIYFDTKRIVNWLQYANEMENKPLLKSNAILHLYSILFPLPNVK